MTPQLALETIERVAATSSKNEKQELIKEALAEGFFRSILIRALDGFRTFGVAKLPPQIDTTASEDFNHATFEMIDRLESRELSGNAAKAAIQLEMARLNPASRELLKRVLLKDLRAGFSASTVNKAWPGLIPTFDCMLAEPFEDKRAKNWPMIAEPKLDGVRVLTFVDFDDGKVQFFSRSGQEFSTFDSLKAPVLNMIAGYRSALMAKACQKADAAGIPDGNDMSSGDMSALDELYAEAGVDGLRLIFDSEVVSGSFNKTVGEVRRKSEQAEDACLYIFDVLPIAAFERDDKGGYEPAGTYEQRRSRLAEIIGHAEKDGPLKLIPAFSVKSVAEIHHLYDKVREKGIEGLIIKDPKALYHRRRNYAWMKIKAQETVEARVIGAYFGEPGKQFAGTLGGLIVDFKGVEVQVGGGFSVKRDGRSRDEFYEALCRDLAKLGKAVDFWKPETDSAASFVLHPEDLAEPGKVLGRQVEVLYHEVTPDGSLRHPRYKRFRDDKPLEKAA